MILKDDGIPGRLIPATDVNIDEQSFSVEEYRWCPNGINRPGVSGIEFKSADARSLSGG
jgi:hypothetical protein